MIQSSCTIIWMIISKYKLTRSTKVLLLTYIWLHWVKHYRMFANETKYKVWCIDYSTFSTKLEQSFITSHEWNQKYESCLCVHPHFRNRISRYNKQYDMFDSQIKRNVTYLSRYLQHELYVLAKRSDVKFRGLKAHYIEPDLFVDLLSHNSNT